MKYPPVFASSLLNKNCTYMFHTKCCITLLQQTKIHPIKNRFRQWDRLCNDRVFQGFDHLKLVDDRCTRSALNKLSRQSYTEGELQRTTANRGERCVRVRVAQGVTGGIVTALTCVNVPSWFQNFLSSSGAVDWGVYWVSHRRSTYVEGLAPFPIPWIINYAVRNIYNNARNAYV